MQFNELSVHEKAQMTYKALQERKKKRMREAKMKDKLGLELSIESIKRHKGKDDRKYFF